MALAHPLKSTRGCVGFASSAMPASISESLKDEHIRQLLLDGCKRSKIRMEFYLAAMRQDEEFGTYMVNNLSRSFHEPRPFLSVIDVSELAISMSGWCPPPLSPDEEDVELGRPPSTISITFEIYCWNRSNSEDLSRL